MGDLRGGAMEPASYVADAATRLHRAVVHIGSARLRPWNLTLSSYVALRVLEARPDLTLAQLSRRCFVRPQTMTRMVTQLETRGWVERSRRPSDDRALSLRLSEQGCEALHDMDLEVKKLNATINRALTPTEIETLNELLRRCAGAVEDELRASYPKDAY
jgi:DNA-binding MarR family transcriptional regulator